jgi:energy-coupling factor transport system permease protein
MLGIGVAAAVAGLRSAGRRVQRTRYRPDAWHWPELVVAASGIVVAVLGWWMSRYQITVAYPALDAFPQVSGVALGAAAIGLLGALCSPPPAREYVAPAVPRRQEVAA